MRGEGFDRGAGHHQRGNLFVPGQFFQQAVQIDDADGERGFGQGRQVRT